MSTLYFPDHEYLTDDKWAVTMTDWWQLASRIPIYDVATPECSTILILYTSDRHI